MKWIFALLFVFSYSSFAVESAPAKFTYVLNPGAIGSCTISNGSNYGNISMAECASKASVSWVSNGCTIIGTATKTYYCTWNASGFAYQLRWGAPYTTSGSEKYVCPPDGKPTFTTGPIELNGTQVCQTSPKVCKMGAIVRIQSDGKETCVPNCGAAAGLTNSSQFFYQAGPTVGSTAGEIKCFGQCSITTVGSSLQLSSGAWTGTYTFTGSTCPVVRPEPVSSESEIASGTPAQPVDESTTSQGTTDSLNQLANAASSATNTPVQPTATGPDNTATLKDVTKTIADSANAQIKATSSQNAATGNLLSNISKDLQNAIIKSGTGGGGGGASASLQAQGNTKLDGIKDTLQQISDKLDEEETGDGPFVPGAGSGAFWESVIPESSFTEIKDKKAESIQKMKDLATEFQTSLQFTELSASGEPDEWTLNMHGTALPFGMGAFQMILDMGLAAVVLLLCALYAVYIIANRK
ncbi:hypothetical protein [Aeromonas dhakensis]|uniref:hypothetical protein n=1 Tax=Aeromonas dhakensis TaxID=196024 RepID=UPI000AE7B569|nr:hypothetical protein [Aeromonas dhakensis]